jgi:membrane-associated phospholipid phosphatase
VRDRQGVRISGASPAWLGVAGTSLLGFVLLAALASRWSTPDASDLAVQRAVLALRTPGLTTLLRLCTTLGTLPVVVGTTLTGALVLRRRTRSWVSPVVLALAVSASALTIALVKVAVGRHRPAAQDRIGPAALDFAFPSGHTGDGCTALVLATTLICLTLPPSATRRLVLGAALLAGVAIGFSRIYLGYHWPTDVAGGWLLATTFTCGAAYAALRVRGRRDAARPQGGTIGVEDRAC